MTNVVILICAILVLLHFLARWDGYVSEAQKNDTLQCSALLSHLALVHKKYEPRCEKTGLRGFRPGPTKTGLRNH